MILTGSLCAQSEFRSKLVPGERIAQYQDLAEQWLAEYLRVDTTNPPGHEMRAVEFYKKVLDSEGIESQVFEFDKGHDRGNIYAVLRGSGKKRPLILLNHMDVVSSDPKRWKLPPFSGQIANGYLYGRGAQDMKNEGLAQLVVMVMLKREKVALDRDVIFLATADEEVNGDGSDWMIKNKPELIHNAEFLITEGGYNFIEGAKVKFVGVDVAEKTTFWLTVTAKGKPGHGSAPMVDSAPNRLVRALTKIIAYQTELKLTPTVEEYLKVMAPFQPKARAEIYRNIRKYLQDPKFRASLPRDELNSKLRNTITLTMFGGSQQTNVVPGEAYANLDVRILPGEDPRKLLAALIKLVNDPNIEIKPQSEIFRKANSSPTNTELFAVFKRVAKEHFGGAPVAPILSSGYTENQRYRELGIASYGFSPYAVATEVSSTEHGDDERIAVDQVRRGFRVLFDVVTGVAATGQD
ncbi:MAG: M20/M25/M40 family metallo-hydrolase [Acidobacteriales bacterium]|nr:M20/M25/M40 family metallo-hydrolase [Terriglobales bacterium]